MHSLGLADSIVFSIYLLMVIIYGWSKYNKKDVENSQDFFFSKNSLPWWAIGACYIGANISAEQFVGMSASGFKMGLAIATYEWMAAATLIVTAIFFIPAFIKKKVSTMPQFLSQRYNGTVAMTMAIFWLMLYVVVNLTSVMYLGALAIHSLSGYSVISCMIFLALFSIFFSMGGMKVIAYTNGLQVFFLILGGLATSYLAIQLVSVHYDTLGLLKGFSLMTQKASDHFHMIFSPGDSYYTSLPGLTVLFGGMWIVNLNYWGCNQYIIQSALGTDVKTARSGILFAAFIKLLIPIIVVLPGIAAFILFRDGQLQNELLIKGSVNADKAYPALMNMLPSGLKGLSAAALTAAVVSTLTAMSNSVSTIFTLDIYKKVINKEATEIQLVKVGRIAIIAAVFAAVIIAPFIGIDKQGGFEFIQEYTGFVSPGILAMFLLGLFWRRTTSNAALFAAFGGFFLSVGFKFFPEMIDLSFLAPTGFIVMTGTGGYEIPFLDRMMLVFIICVLVMAIISILETRNKENPKGIKMHLSEFKFSKDFAIGSAIVLVFIVALYAFFW
jgi:SSS family solute:Na+ symporter